MSFHFQLVEQLESSEGPPPADQNKIESLPTLTITQEHIDTGTYYIHVHNYNYTLKYTYILHSNIPYIVT